MLPVASIFMQYRVIPCAYSGEITFCLCLWFRVLNNMCTHNARAQTLALLLQHSHIDVGSKFEAIATEIYIASIFIYSSFIRPNRQHDKEQKKRNYDS